MLMVGGLLTVLKTCCAKTLSKAILSNHIFKLVMSRTNLLEPPFNGLPLFFFQSKFSIYPQSSDSNNSTNTKQAVSYNLNPSGPTTKFSSSIPNKPSSLFNFKIYNKIYKQNTFFNNLLLNNLLLQKSFRQHQTSLFLEKINNILAINIT